MHKERASLEESFHPRFGDLGRPESVLLSRFPASHPSLCERPFHTIHLTVTRRCFARCRGCVNTSITCSGAGEGLPDLSHYETDPARDARCILHLLGRDGEKEEAAVCFYGGEPLLAAEAMERIVRFLDAEPPRIPLHYMIYTNGDLLESFVDLHPELARRVFLYALSVDGGKEQHEAIRPGTSLARIRKGLARLGEERKGTVLVWSTLRERQSLDDCFCEFLRLHEEGLADQFFWHWVETKEPFESFDLYLAGYEKDFGRILEVYLEWLRRGRILPLVHVNELVLYVLTGRARGSSGCGVEVADNFDLIGGVIHSCADLPLEMAIGRIGADGAPVFGDYDLSALVEYKERLGCLSCGVHSYCGGRCPVQAHVGTQERLLQYCRLMRLHCGLVLEKMEEISGLLAEQRIPAQRIYDGSAFYTQFTDVTP